MSLYYEAEAVLTNAEKTGGSLKSRIFGKKTSKHSPAQIYALVSEATKWSPVLKSVVERSGLLKSEKKAYSPPTPVLAQTLTDFSGI
jgi:putative methyltransferase